MFREQLAHLINKEPDMCICGEADTIRDALELLQSASADIVIVDLTLKGPSGLELLKDLKAHQVNVPVLVLSMHDEMLYAERVLRAGAKGYISKNEDSSQVMAAIHRVLAGEVYVSERMTVRILQRISSGAPVEASGIELLSDRELEVFQ